MRFASCERGEERFVARIDDDLAIPLEGLDELGLATTIEALAGARARTGDAVRLSEVALRPAVPNPTKILCVGLNYFSHVGETGREVPTYPVLFNKFASSLTGPYDRVPLPPESTQIDFEGEMAVVIGRPGRRIAEVDALSHVAGLTVGNDITMRDYQYKTHQWLQGKAWDRSTPLGPWIVTPDEIGDPGDLSIELRLNGETMQSASTAQLMFSVPVLISRISEFTTLLPGDVILTGTPGGVGFRRDPKLFIQPGDRIDVEVSGIGRIENEFVAEILDPPPTSEALSEAR